MTTMVNIRDITTETITRVDSVRSTDQAATELMHKTVMVTMAATMLNMATITTMVDITTIIMDITTTAIINHIIMDIMDIMDMVMVMDLDMDLDMDIDSGEYLTSTKLGLDLPGDNCCNLYQHNNYGGVVSKHCISADEQMYVHDFTGEWFDNAMNSWACGKNVAYMFCDYGPNDDCYNYHGLSGAGAALNPYVRHGNWLTTIKMV